MALRLAAADDIDLCGVRRGARAGRRARGGRRPGARPASPTLAAPGRRGLRDGARRRPGARRARRDPRRRAATGRRSSSTRRSRRARPAQLADTAARHGVKVVDAPVSGGAMGAADGTLAIMVGGSDEAFAAARPALDAMGVAGHPRRADRRRHEVQAGPQPDALRRVHRRDRGAAARRGGRARPGRARQGGAAHRRDHRRAGRDHAPGDDGTDRQGRLLVRRLRRTSARWGRRT